MKHELITYFKRKKVAQDLLVASIFSAKTRTREREFLNALEFGLISLSHKSTAHFRLSFQVQNATFEDF